MSESLQGFRVRKLADKSEGKREKRYDPLTGDSYLADPDTWTLEDRDTWVSSPWPLAGVVVEGDLPKKTSLNTGFVNKAIAEGWATMENRNIVHRPGGPEDDPWRVTHTFVQADSITFKLLDGDVKYRVTKNPDKYPDQKNEFDEGFGGTVEWNYEVELVEGEE